MNANPQKIIEKKNDPLYNLGIEFMSSKEFGEAWNKIHSFCQYKMEYGKWYDLNSIVNENKYPKWRQKLVEIIKDIIQRKADIDCGFSLEFSNDYKRIKKYEWDPNFTSGIRIYFETR
jgi:hypothetical protein